MDGNQENFEFTDPETGEVFPLNGASLVSNVRDILLGRRRQQTEATVWKSLTEAQQKDEITAMQELARSLVGSVVMRVAEKGLTCAHVEINKFAVDVDKGEVTITSKGFASDEMLSDLAHSKGKTAKITVVDAEQFNKKSTMVKPDADQPSLLPDEEDQQPFDEQPDTSVQLDDSDGLHDAPASNYVSDDQLAGYRARMQGEPSNSGPDINSPERDDWYLGWKEADAKEDAPDIIEPQPDTEPAGANSTNDTDETAPQAKDEAGQAADDADYISGVDAARDGKGPDDNPFDGGTDEYLAWDKGLTEGRQQIAELRKDGYDARNEGMAPTRCTWKKGTPEHGFWMEGYEQAKKDEAD